MNPKILVYVTDDKDRIVSGDPLVMLLPQGEEREEYLADLGRTLRANVVRLVNGDHILIST